MCSHADMLKRQQNKLAKGLLAWLQHVQLVPMKNAVLRQHLLEIDTRGPGPIIHTLPAGGGQVQDVCVCQPPLAACTAGVHP